MDNFKVILFIVIMVLLFPGFFAALLEGIATAIFMIAVAAVIIMILNAATRECDPETAAYRGW